MGGRESRKEAGEEGGGGGGGGGERSVRDNDFLGERGDEKS